MTHVTIPNSQRSLTSGYSVIGEVKPEKEIRATLHLKSSKDLNGEKLRAFLLGTEARSLKPHSGLINQSPGQRRHLTRDEFAASYGITPADLLKVRQFAHEYGLRVVPDAVARVIGANPLALKTVELRGTVAAFTKAFKVKIMRVKSPKGRVFRYQEGPISVPSEFEKVIKNVTGFDTRPQAFPRVRPLKDGAGLVAFRPDQVAKLYNFPPAPLSGKGQTIGIIELGGGARNRDLKAYFKSLGIPKPSITYVSVGSASNAPTGNPNGPDCEVMLDIEVAGAVAPGAKIVVYFAANNNRGFSNAVNYAVHDKKHSPTILSISWGGPEKTYSQPDLTSFEDALQAAVALGVSVFVAAGDDGCTDGLTDGLAHVDYPASSWFVTACGGTRLVTDASGATISEESVWNDGASGGGTGGGISAIFGPAPYQVGIPMPPSVNAGASLGCGVPDVAGNADPMTGYKTRVDGQNFVIGGTSAVAPLWAGLFALINESLGKPVGYVNTLLYSSTVKGAGGSSANGPLRDILQGNNDTTSSFGGRYMAGSPWNACTGLGTPDGTKLLSAIASS